jgi:hypothetical protein
MSSVTPAAGLIHVGMDVSKNTIAVGVVMPGQEIPVINRIWNDEGSVRHLIARLGDPAALRCCYEAGPCGFGLYRLLASMGVACDVVAPSLIPRRAGDRVKTDRGYPSNRTELAWLRATGGSLGAVPGLAAFPGFLAEPVLAWGGWWRAGRGSGPAYARRPVP